MRYFHISNYACFSALGPLWLWKLESKPPKWYCQVRLTKSLPTSPRQPLCILIQTQIMPNLVFWAQNAQIWKSGRRPPNLAFLKYCYIFRCLLSLRFQRAFNHYPSIIFDQMSSKSLSQPTVWRWMMEEAKCFSDTNFSKATDILSIFLTYFLVATPPFLLMPLPPPPYCFVYCFVTIFIIIPVIIIIYNLMPMLAWVTWVYLVPNFQ